MKPDTVNVPEVGMEDAPDWYCHDSASGWACGWNACREYFLAAAPKAEPVEADDFGDALLAFLFRNGLKVALDVSEIEALRQSAIRAQPEAPKVEQAPVAWRDWSAGSRPPMSGEWFVAKCAEAVRVVHYADKHDRLPIDHSGWVWPSLPTHWVPLREFAHPAPSSDELLEAYYEALVPADLKIRSLPNTDQSDVEFIRVALAKRKGPQS